MDKKMEEVAEDFPYIGKNNSFLLFLVLSTILFVPLALVLKEEKMELKRVGEIECKVIDSFAKSIPSFVACFLGKITFSSCLKKGLKKEQRKETNYECDWCWDYIDGKEHDYNYQVKITKCGINEYWKKLGIDEYLPHGCSVDYALFGRMGVKFERTKTISMGFDCCDFKMYGRVKDIEELQKPWPLDDLPDWKNYKKKKNENIQVDKKRIKLD